MTRHRVIVELHASRATLPRGISRKVKLAKLRQVADEAKRRIAPLLDTYRSIDPELKVASENTIFPVLIITTTDPVIARLQRLDCVKRLASAQDFQLA